MDFLDGDLFWNPMIPSLSNQDRTEIYQNKNKWSIFDRFGDLYMYFV